MGLAARTLSLVTLFAQLAIMHAQDFNYTIIKSTTITITRYACPDGAATIATVPGTIEGLPVTNIEANTSCVNSNSLECKQSLVANNQRAKRCFTL